MKLDTKKHPLISVVLVNYNNSRYVSDCINSVLSQTYPNIEIVFCDDSSTDDSIKIFEKIISGTKRKVTINKQYRKKNGGRGGAFNKYTGVCNFTGEYVCFLDTDDIIHKEHIQILFSLIKKYSTDISAVNQTSFNNDDIPTSISIPVKPNVKIINTHDNIDKFYFMNPEIDFPFSSSYRLYNKEIFRDIKNLPENYFLNSDSCFSIFAFINSKTLAQAYNVNTYLYRIIDTSDSHSSWYRCLKNNTFDSVSKLSTHYSRQLPKLVELIEYRNNKTIKMIFEAAINEKITYRQIRNDYRVYINKQNKADVINLLFSNTDSLKQRLARKAFKYTPLFWYLINTR